VAVVVRAAYNSGVWAYKPVILPILEINLNKSQGANK